MCTREFRLITSSNLLYQMGDHGVTSRDHTSNRDHGVARSVFSPLAGGLIGKLDRDSGFFSAGNSSEDVLPG